MKAHEALALSRRERDTDARLIAFAYIYSEKAHFRFRTTALKAFFGQQLLLGLFAEML